ncbi:hypothetical protein KOW79_011595 [Hemibagrus wyckioides]|uniref:Uncharacterized protein n=1 Tax=Hemibagrus wyckioides TaxID=337641 RepID=A0A9D3SN03_9TELE|nr:hypothetical protein KOW79_011595 [Hemibagrus wyckioides]
MHYPHRRYSLHDSDPQDEVQAVFSVPLSMIQRTSCRCRLTSLLILSGWGGPGGEKPASKQDTFPVEDGVLEECGLEEDS